MYRQQENGGGKGYLTAASRSAEFHSYCEYGERSAVEAWNGAQNNCCFLDNAKRHALAKRELGGDYAVNKSDFCVDEAGHDLFDMSSFFREHETPKMDTENYAQFPADVEEGRNSSSTRSDHEECLVPLDGENASSEMMEDDTIDASDASVDSVVMGIPYYVACQWQQMQQQQQQQQQAVMMLWWQAYLSGAYTMLGPKGMTASAAQLGWSLPTAGGLAALHGAYASFGEDAFYQQMMTMDDKGQGTNSGTKRRRKNDATHNSDLHPGSSKKGRRPRHDERVCRGSVIEV